MHTRPDSLLKFVMLIMPSSLTTRPDSLLKFVMLIMPSSLTAVFIFRAGWLVLRKSSLVRNTTVQAGAFTRAGDRDR